MENNTDKQLISAYLSGNQNALDALIKRYLKPTYGFVYSLVGNSENAEDITQEVFLKVWRNIKKFDKQKDFKTWIFAIAKNTVIDFLRKKKEIPFSAFETENGNLISDNLADSTLLPDKVAKRLDLKNEIAIAMKVISSKYSLILSLYYQKDLTFREIAEMLGEPLNTVKSRHRRGLVLLRETISRT